jgi:hypothetical protein
VIAASIIRIALMMEAASTSETSVNYQTTRHNIPEDSHLHTCRHENLKSRVNNFSHLWTTFLGSLVASIQREDQREL